MVHQTTSFSKFIPSPWWTDTVASRLVQLHKPALGHQTVHLRRKGRRKRGSRSESRRNGRRAHTSQYSSSSPIFIFMNFSEPILEEQNRPASGPQARGTACSATGGRRGRRREGRVL